MVVVRFSAFEDKIRSGEKKQTIRPIKNYAHLQVGDLVHCYSTEKREGVSRPVLKDLLYRGVCTDIIPRIFYGGFKWNDDIARRDGFKDSEEMRQWFEAKYPSLLYSNKCFRIIRWE